MKYREIGQKELKMVIHNVRCKNIIRCPRGELCRLKNCFYKQKILGAYNDRRIIENKLFDVVTTTLSLQDKIFLAYLYYLNIKKSLRSPKVFEMVLKKVLDN